MEDTESVPSYNYVRTLSEPIHGSNRNITCDNWFTSVPLAKRMKSSLIKLSIIGTIRKNKKEVPNSFKTASDVGQSKFLYDEEKTLVSYTPKRNKMVLLLSTLHKKSLARLQISQKLYYNKTKGGTDTFDQLCQKYTTCRMTRR